MRVCAIMGVEDGKNAKERTVERGIFAEEVAAIIARNGQKLTISSANIYQTPLLNQPSRVQHLVRETEFWSQCEVSVTPPEL